ncbi:MAG: tetratricopeptide repeat protein [Halothiobacillaceae bacterium]|nr:tetratricopeptide repeat protein [Halothiobacillaceae bacterium]
MDGTLRPGRNDLCHCGSGKKYKKCCASARRPIVASVDATPSATLYNELVGLFNAGRHHEVETRANMLLNKYPDSGFIWMLLGAALGVQGKDALAALQKAAVLLPGDANVQNNLGNAQRKLCKYEEAAASYRMALEIAPGFVEAHYNLGNALRDLGQLEEALKSYLQALQLKPDYAEAHFSLGNVQKALGQLEDAVASYRCALALKPDINKGHLNLAATLQDLGRFDEALINYRRTLEIAPDDGEAFYGLGDAQRNLGRQDDALVSYRRALEISPDFAEAHCNLGLTLRELGQHVDAVACYRRALDIKPDLAEVYCNLGISQKELGRLDDAVASYRESLKIRPDLAQTHYNLGITLCILGRNEEAVASYRRALEIDVNFAKAYLNLGGVLKDLGRLEEAVVYLRRALVIDPDYVDAQSSLLFIHNYLANQPTMLLLDEARRLGDMVAKTSRPYITWPNARVSKNSLRVGLVSGDFRDHPVGYFIEGLLAAIASSSDARLEMIGYYNHHVNDLPTERIKACCKKWRSAVSLSDEALAAKIYDDAIDILIDLSGHTAHNRLPVFAWKPAPVQASWLGYFATTGVTEIDYLLGDSHVTPPGEERHFTEQVWRLPETYLCFTEPDVEVPVAPLPASANGHVTFGCFNNLSKMNDEVVALWARVLHAVPHSRLMLKTKQLGEASVRQSVSARFAAHGIDAGRLILEGFAPRAELLASYNRVDIALDPFPYPGGTTSVEALWMGVPVLTKRGDRFVSHVGETVAHNAGQPDWIAADEEAYIAKAVDYASDLIRLANLRAGLRARVLASPLFDAPRFARHFEEAMWGMWNRRLTQQGG